MQRIVTVTSGYLRFTFTSMLAASVAFSLTGLAITAPRLFFLVIAVAVTVFLVVRMEVKTHRHARELAKKNDPKDYKREVQAWAEYLAFAEATSILLSEISGEVRMRKPSLWISEWHLAFDPKTPPQTLDSVLTEYNATVDKILLEKTKLEIAAIELQRHQTELAAKGFYIVSISEIPAYDIVRSIRRTPERMHHAMKSRAAKEINRPITIVFIHDSGVSFQIEAIQKLLQASFQMVESGVHLPMKSTPS